MFFKSTSDDAYARRLEGRVEALERQVLQLNQQVRALSADLGVEMVEHTGSSGMPEVASARTNEVSAAIHSLLSEGKTVAAIKAYREETGSGLLEAKEKIEAVVRQYGYKSS